MAASEFCQEVQGVRFEGSANLRQGHPASAFQPIRTGGGRMAQMGTFPRGLLTHEGRDFRPIAMRPDEC